MHEMIVIYFPLDGYPASLGFPIMQRVNIICTQSIIAITYNHVIHLSNNTL